MGANVQVCWEKFCNYWEVEARTGADGGRPLPPRREHEAVKRCDENTIGVVAILGSTFDGSYEPVADIAAALDELAASGGPDVPMHVDAASGGMVAPFLDPDLVWDFRLPRVASINTSGHKYGLVYPGVGWAIWRDAAALPEDLVFQVNYLGGEMPTFALNFSRPGAEVIAQYYTFFRLGFEGMRAVQQASRDVATTLAAEIEAMDEYRLITRGDQLPVFAFTTAGPRARLGRLRGLARAARARLAGARVHLPGEPHRPRRTARGVPARFLTGPGRAVPARPARRHRPAQRARRSASAIRTGRLPPLSMGPCWCTDTTLAAIPTRRHACRRDSSVPIQVRGSIQGTALL